MQLALTLTALLIVATVLRHQVGVIQLLGLCARVVGEVIASASWKLNERLGHAIGRTFEGLQYRGPRCRDTLSSWAGWAVINPVLNTVLFIPLLLADVQLNSLRLSSLFGTGTYRPLFGIGLDQLGGILMALITVALGLAIWDLAGGVPGAFIWHNLPGALRAFLALIFGAALAANLLAAALLSAWVQASHEDLLPLPFIPVPTLVFNAVLLACLHLAVLATGAGLLAFFAALWMVVLGALRLLTLVFWLPSALLVIMYDTVLAALVLGAYALACVGTTLHNWVCGFRWSQTLGLWPIEPPTKPEPLPPAQLGGWWTQAPRILQLSAPGE